MMSSTHSGSAFPAHYDLNKITRSELDKIQQAAAIIEKMGHDVSVIQNAVKIINLKIIAGD